MATILVQNCVETICNLNAALVTTTASDTETYVFNEGTYKLIDDMISKLVAIKNGIKTEEKNIMADMLLEVRDIEDGVDIDGRTIPTGTMTAADVSVSLQGGGALQDRMHGDNADNTGTITRYTMAVTDRTYPAVYIANGNDYTESAVFMMLSQAAILIANLKDGRYGAATVAAAEVLLVT